MNHLPYKEPRLYLGNFASCFEHISKTLNIKLKKYSFLAILHDDVKFFIVNEVCLVSDNVGMVTGS
jgi:hypothetical protein